MLASVILHILLLYSVWGQFDSAGGPVRSGRATNYGPSDQFNSDWNTGTCKCWTSAHYTKTRPCFDYITGPSHIAAVNTNGMDYTATCGTCLAVSCINGPTRGNSWSMYSYPSCKPGGPVVFVQVTDSCPCGQNQSNAKWCCNTTGTITRHLDLSSPAFGVIADPDAGAIDVLFQEVPCPDAATVAPGRVLFSS